MAMPEEVKRETLDFSQLMVHMGIGRDALKKLIEAGGMPAIQYGESRYITPIRALEAWEDELGRLAARKYMRELSQEEDAKLRDWQRYR